MSSRLDSPYQLTKYGKQQVKTAAADPRLQTKFQKVYVSPLVRTRQTYQILAANNQFIAAAPHEFDKSVKEIDVGHYEGRRVDGFPLLFMALWREIMRRLNFVNFRLKDGESWHDVARRMAGRMAQITATNRGDGAVLIISHADTIWGAMAAARAANPQQNPRPHYPKNAEIVELALNKSDAARLAKWAQK
jgi:broad specificity phosphatase PhoE